MTFSDAPTKPHVGYGYIEAGGTLGDGFDVIWFKEKLNLETAEKSLKTGGFYWNSGMFLFRASRYLEELQIFQPDIYQSYVSYVANALAGLDFIRVDADAF